LRVFVLAHLATCLIIISAAPLLWRGDWRAYPTLAGILPCVVAAGLDAWVLLIEINR
jgi:hypothetical protein